MRLAAIQMKSVSDVAANLALARELMDRAVAEGQADWILLPEHFHWAGGSSDDRLAAAEVLGEGPGFKCCQSFARERGVIVHAGSIFERVPSSDKIFNTSVVFGRSGEQIATYRKIHLFDIDAPGGATYRESDTVERGRSIVTYAVDGITFGCSICYDLRFPELFQALADAGADVIAAPAAFLFQTGKDHWEPLLRARAIETQTYIVAAGSWGEVPYGGKPHRTFGHSMIVDAWGTVVAQEEEGDGFVVANVDASVIARVRQDMPIRRHRTLDSLYGRRRG